MAARRANAAAAACPDASFAVTFISTPMRRTRIGCCAHAPAMPVIGFMSGRSPFESTNVVNAFRQGLNQVRYSEKNVSRRCSAMEGKRLGLLREIIPGATLIAVLFNPIFANFQDPSE
jgi:hypothetical protein